MCGIAGIYRRHEDTPLRNMGRLADSLLLGIAHRGSDATGLLAMTGAGERTLIKATDPCARFVLQRRSFPRDARTVLLHTRFATRGAADDPRNAHPVIAGPVAAIHNGTIYNDKALFAQHAMKRTAAVDSIVIPSLIRKFGWDNARKALGKLEGGAATAIVSQERPDELILARVKTYPMHVLVGPDVVLWASERVAISMAWKHTYGRAPVGEWVTLDEHEIMSFAGGAVDLDSLPKPRYTTRKLVGFGNGIPKGKGKAGRKGKGAAKPKALPAAPMLPLPDTQLFDDDRGDRAMVEQNVRDLMAWAGCDYDDAYEEVTGMQAPADGMTDEQWSWVDDVLRSGNDV